jgi:enamine deaminase RidA (YjgF/YER057c/UK114 family)
MANPTFHNYASAESQSIVMHYSQAVILPGGTIKTSGQGGWDSNGSVAASASEQVDLAFKNVDKALQAVDSRLSWKNVYAVRSYHINIDETAELVIAKFKSEMGDRRPIWTCVEVSKLGIEGMVVEIEVEAVL